MACDDNKCTGVVGPDFGLDENGVPKQPASGSCTTTPSGRVCPPGADVTCTPFQLTDNNDACIQDRYVNEALTIGGAEINVYKLLGVHEQGLLVDVTGMGAAISGGSAPGFPAANAFDIFVTEWHSLQTGQGVISSAYIGYDFGEIKIADGSRRQYGIETSIQKHITAIAIKQSSDPSKRVTRARVERSDDGINWYGVSIIMLPDDDCLNTILLKSSVLSRYWRLRPLDFNGGATDFWAILAFQMFHNYVATNVDNIQDLVFLENRDRDYNTEAIQLKGHYDLLDTQTELSRYGIELPSQAFYITINFSACVALLGRPLVIGDVIELPSEAQYSTSLRKIKKYLEITDVGWSTEGYTPGWTPTLLRVIAMPMFASQETQDIIGDLSKDADASGLFDIDDGHNPNFQDYSDVSQWVENESKEILPERGAEGSDAIRQFEPEELQAAATQGLGNLTKIGLNSTGLYVEDAMPPNGAPFTEGDALPAEADATNGDYHRLTYSGLSADVPPRLYRFSAAKGRWIFLESDRRAEFDPAKPRLQEFISSPTRVSNTHVTNDTKD